MAGKGNPNSWLGSLQLTPTLVTCHTLSIVGVWFSPGSLHARVAPTNNNINAVPPIVLTNVFFILYSLFCFAVRRSLPRPRAIRVGEGQRPFHHSCAASGKIVSLNSKKLPN